MADDVMSLYIKDIYHAPRLTREQELALVSAAHAGDLSARNKLVVSHLRFVVSVARKYHSPGLDLADLVSEGNLGLLRAVKTFDPHRGIFFLSYAVWWIRQSIIKAIQQKSRLIRLPQHRVAELSLIEKAQDELRNLTGNEPDLRELAATLEMDEDDVQSLLMVSRELTSLDCECSLEEGGTLMSYLASSEPTPDEYAAQADLQRSIDRMLSLLSDRESDIIRSRFGLDNRKPLSLSYLSKRYKVTKERIRQIEKRALQQMGNEDNWRYFEGMELA